MESSKLGRPARISHPLARASQEKLVGKVAEAKAEWQFSGYRLSAKLQNQKAKLWIQSTLLGDHGCQAGSRVCSELSWRVLFASFCSLHMEDLTASRNVPSPAGGIGAGVGSYRGEVGRGPSSRMGGSS